MRLNSIQINCLENDDSACLLFRISFCSILFNDNKFFRRSQTRVELNKKKLFCQNKIPRKRQFFGSMACKQRKTLMFFVWLKWYIKSDGKPSIQSDIVDKCDQPLKQILSIETNSESNINMFARSVCVVLLALCLIENGFCVSVAI